MTLQRIALVSAVVNATPYDADAAAFIARVEAADAAAGQSGGLERLIQNAIHTFFISCKADESPIAGVSNFQALKSACIMAGAKTRQGARVPLLPTMATITEHGAAGGWVYDRKQGLRGNGADNYLNSNRNLDSDPQNNNAIGAYLTANSGSGAILGATPTTGTPESGSGQTLIVQAASTSTPFRSRLSTFFGNTGTRSTTTSTGFIGLSRHQGNSFTTRTLGSDESIPSTTASPPSIPYFIFARNLQGTANLFTASTISFFAIGEAFNLATLDARVTTLVNAITAAIP